MKDFFAELKRRNVYKVAVAYAVIAWLLIQAGSILVSHLRRAGLDNEGVCHVDRAGFVIALLVAWAFEMTPQGMKRTEDAESLPGEGRVGWKGLTLLVVVAGAGAMVLLWFQIAPGKKGPPPSARSGVERKSIAVLPFENLSEDKANAYFADGMQDEIITRLTKIGELKVISRSSTQRYRSKGENVTEIARQLGVAHVVEGSVQKVGDRVRINIQLIEAQTDDHLWAELYDRNLTDIFAVQSELATAIAQKLQAKLSGREQEAVAEKSTENVAAYDAYLRGIDFDSRPGDTAEDVKQAAASYEEAVLLDPQFAQAWAALARSSASLYFQHFDASPERKEAARRATETATRLAPAASETLLANAYYCYHIERDYNRARDLFEKLRVEIPSNTQAIEALARIARRQSRWRDSLRLFEQAAKLNPRDPRLFMDRAWTLSVLREFRATEEMIDQALTITPDDPDVLVNKAVPVPDNGETSGSARGRREDSNFGRAGSGEERTDSSIDPRAPL